MPWLLRSAQLCPGLAAARMRSRKGGRGTVSEALVRAATISARHGSWQESHYDDSQHAPVLAAYGVQSAGAGLCDGRVGQRGRTAGEGTIFTTLLRFLYGTVMICPRPVRYTHLRVLSVRTRTKTGLAITLCRAQSPAPLTTRTAPHDVCQGNKNACLGQASYRVQSAAVSMSLASLKGGSAWNRAPATLPPQHSNKNCKQSLRSRHGSDRRPNSFGKKSKRSWTSPLKLSNSPGYLSNASKNCPRLSMQKGPLHRFVQSLYHLS